MSRPMTYSDFVSSLDQNRLHFVSGRSVRIKGFGFVQEPVYALESSGSVRSKVFIHSLSSIRGSCLAFLKTFDMNSQDRWGLCLSTAHVAGFSVLARTYFGKFEDPYCFEWSKDKVVAEVEKNKVTILSLVPTQIFDLVKTGIEPPSCLRMVFVGGAKLSDDLRASAETLGWPIVECYGSTETFAQMSYSKKGGRFTPFEDWSIKVDEDEVLVSGPGLFKGQVKEGIYRSRKKEWFPTGDMGTLHDGKFEILGKKEGLIKIKGSYLDFNRLKTDFQKFLAEEEIDPSSCFLVCLKEKRDGAGVYAISTSKDFNNEILSAFHSIRGVFHLSCLERSALGKLQTSSLTNVLKKTVLSL